MSHTRSVLSPEADACAIPSGSANGELQQYSSVFLQRAAVSIRLTTGDRSFQPSPPQDEGEGLIPGLCKAAGGGPARSLLILREEECPGIGGDPAPKDAGGCQPALRLSASNGSVSN